MRKRSGFTLVELLIVIGIIVALAAILLPALHRAYMVAERSAISSDLQVISNALEAYRSDFGEYPKPNKVDGTHTLCWALISPGPASEDGADGPGFRLRGTTGRVYGPYLPPDRFVLGTETGQSGDISIISPYSQSGKLPLNEDAVIGDRRGRVILYFPADRRAKPSGLPNTYVGVAGPFATSFPMWIPGLGDRTGSLMPDYCLRNLLGAARDGSVPPGTTPITAPFLLISAGTSDPIAQVNGIGPQAPNSGLPNPFGQVDNVANVPLSPVLPIADYTKS